MTSQVYYRKWRPRRFRELVGQEHVSSTLCQAVIQGRVAHSYLFCGPRGTGKTSAARVLAKAVNCVGPQDGDPCDACGHCLALNEGRFMDLIELDAASNRGIDEIRSIRDKINLGPVEGGYKVYIIDEAHMLTEHASNAFLKTLEEPPSHAIFILCTTEPHKILPTIISRCQRFDFRRLSSSVIIERLRIICLGEGVEVEEGAFKALAHSAGGSLRDAENLLEQLVVSSGGRIGIQEVHDLLGLGQGEWALEFVQYFLLGNSTAALAAINRASWDGLDLRQIHRQAVELLRGVLMLQCGSRDSLDLPQETIKWLEELAPKVSTARVMRSLKLLGEVNMRYDIPSTLPLELAVVEVCLGEAADQASGQPTPLLRSSSAQGRATPRPPESVPVSSTTPRSSPFRERGVGDAGRPATGETAVTQGPPIEGTSPPRQPPARGPNDLAPPGQVGLGTDDMLQQQWGALVRTLSRYKGKRFNIGALLRDCKNQHIDGETLVLTFAHRSHLERMQEELDDPQGMRIVAEALLSSLGASYQLRLTLLDDDGPSSVPPVTQSPLVRAALSMGAKIVDERER